ncbi:flagellar hook-length control protein FliK [Paraherbaspirillum soli]|uniref:Flagellar hook-length control protein FliK n=1 Tax=Paraherbaspirillum soli TaxID=631222 RepID=A0ABW0MDR1_9BURK
MASGTPLVDRLLTVSAMQRSDLVALKAQLAIGGPEPVTDVEPSNNDTRLLSRAGIERQLGLEPGAVNVAVGARQSAAGGAVLSATARTISEILGAASGSAAPVRGSAPLWSSAQAPLPQQLATALARTVTGSGLFYESHLIQFAAGERTLAQLAQEPQARLGPLAQSHPELLSGDPQQALPEPNAALIPQPAVGVGAQQGMANGELPIFAGPAASIVKPPADSAGTKPQLEAHVVASAQDVPPAGLRSHPGPYSSASAANVAAAYGMAAADASGTVAPARPQHAPSAMPAASPAESVHVDNHVANVAAAMHPDAVALVRQQLELLAAPVFCWSGEAWPNAKMDWEIRQRQQGQPDADDADAASKVWSTRLAMSLPNLGALELRLSMNGGSLQAHLAAADDASMAALRADGDDLRQRLTAAGLQLTALQFAPLTPHDALNG